MSPNRKIRRIKTNKPIDKKSYQAFFRVLKFLCFVKLSLGLVRMVYLLLLLVRLLYGWVLVASSLPLLMLLIISGFSSAPYDLVCAKREASVFLRFAQTWECECVSLCCARAQFSCVLVLFTSIPMWNLFDSLTLCFGLFYASIRFNRNIWLFAVNGFGCKADC